MIVQIADGLLSGAMPVVQVSRRVLCKANNGAIPRSGTGHRALQAFVNNPA